ncbi:hypothetical protein TYRP_009415 [Tyrophagus putrescentiae]|nr:hypothetical protein TYRP_009415 [Tyrophagus putrescentiae]
MNLRRFLQLSGVLCLATLLCSSYLILPIIASSLKNLKNGTFEKIGHRPNDTILHSVFPEAAELISQKVLKMERCYLSSVKGGVKLDIFTEPLAVIVYRYLKAYSMTEEGSGSEWLAHLKRRVVNLVANIKDVARHVIDCLRHVDQPDYEPTKLALNRFSSLSLSEFFHLRHPKPLPVSPAKKFLWKNRLNISIAAPPSTLGGDEVLLTSTTSGPASTDHPELVLGSESEEGPKQSLSSFSGGYGGPQISIMYDSFDVDDIADSVLPSSFDYRDLDVVSVVKNQGDLLPLRRPQRRRVGLHAEPQGRRNVSFSEKDAYNCLAKLGYNDAPQVGGQVETVYRMFMETHGIVYEKDAEQYDFTRKDYETPPKEYGLEGEGSLQRLKKIVYKYGPVTTVFRAPMDSRWLQLAGEMNFACNTTAAPMPDHAMLITGWTPTHLVIKNSYGNYEHDDDRWGIKGYLYLNTKYLENCAVLGSVSQLLVPAVED